MDDLNVIDQFTSTFTTYIDSGFGLLSPDVAFLTTTLDQEGALCRGVRADPQ
jgi:type IV secretion system protein TrbL